jgi:hypothetical protein
MRSGFYGLTVGFVRVPGDCLGGVRVCEMVGLG